MAAWSDEEIGGINDLTLGKTSVHRAGAPWRKSPADCVVCNDQGCEFCPKVRDDLGEPFPAETFSLFTDSDIVQLLVDACDELGRRRSPIRVMVA